MLRRAGRAAAWGVAAVVFGAAAGVAWGPTPRPESRTLLAWVFTVLAAVALYLCLAESFGRWRMRRRRGIDLALETVSNGLRLNLSNRGPAAEYFAQVISLRQPPTGRPKGPQHWSIPWLEDHTVKPKRIYPGQTQTFNFAIFDPAALNASPSTSQDGADHWRFPSLPEAIGVKYYNLLNPTDVDDQEFILTVRITNADTEKYRDWQVTVKVRGLEVAGELAPIKHSRFTRPRRRAVATTSWSAGTQLPLGSAPPLTVPMHSSAADPFGGSGGSVTALGAWPRAHGHRS